MMSALRKTSRGPVRWVPSVPGVVAPRRSLPGGLHVSAAFRSNSGSRAMLVEKGL